MSAAVACEGGSGVMSSLDMEAAMAWLGRAAPSLSCPLRAGAETDKVDGSIIHVGQQASICHV